MTISTPPNVADIEEALRDVVDPELGINVVDLGLIYGVQVDQNNHTTIDMTLTSAACPVTDVIEDQSAQALEGIVEREQQVPGHAWRSPPSAQDRR